MSVYVYKIWMLSGPTLGDNRPFPHLDACKDALIATFNGRLDGGKLVNSVIETAEPVMLEMSADEIVRTSLAWEQNRKW